MVNSGRVLLLSYRLLWPFFSPFKCFGIIIYVDYIEYIVNITGGRSGVGPPSSCSSFPPSPCGFTPLARPVPRRRLAARPVPHRRLSSCSSLSSWDSSSSPRRLADHLAPPRFPLPLLFSSPSPGVVDSIRCIVQLLSSSLSGSCC